MKTIVIWDSCGEQPLQFAVLDGDYDYLDDVYLNSDADEELAAELEELQDGLELQDEFPYDVARGAYRVIRCGFLP